jgi:hypothetical protein
MRTFVQCANSPRCADDGHVGELAVFCARSDDQQQRAHPVALPASWPLTHPLEDPEQSLLGLIFRAPADVGGDGGVTWQPAATANSPGTEPIWKPGTRTPTRRWSPDGSPKPSSNAKPPKPKLHAARQEHMSEADDQIADRMVISPLTAKTHIHRVPWPSSTPVTAPNSWSSPTNPAW